MLEPLPNLRMRPRFLAPLIAGLVVFSAVGCSRAKEVTVEQTVIVEQTVVVERTIIATPTPLPNRARATAIVLGSQLTPDGIPVNPRNAFPSNTVQIHAVVLIENAAPGTTITGTWFQLGTPSAGEEGEQVVTSDIILSQVAAGGRSVVTFTLKRETGPLPKDAWLFRVYANGQLLRTASFVISDYVPQTPRLPGISSLVDRTIPDIEARRERSIG
jgi:hypothetical protein